MMARLVAIACVVACSSNANDPLERSLETLRDPDPLRRQSAASSIASSCCEHRTGGADPRACRVTRWILSNAADPELIHGVASVRATSECQVTISPELALTALRRLPVHARRARFAAIDFLSQLEPTEEIIRELVNQLRRADGDRVIGDPVIWQAVGALAELGEADLAIVAMLLDDPSPAVRQWVLHALWQASNDRLELPMLEPLLEFWVSDPEVGVIASSVLAEYRRSARQTEAAAVNKLIAGRKIERLARRRVTCGNLEVIRHLTWLARRDDTGGRARQALRHRKRYCPEE